MYLKALAAVFPDLLLQLCKALTGIVPEFRVIGFLYRINAKRDLLRRYSEKSPLFLPVHLVQALHRSDLRYPEISKNTPYPVRR